MAREVLFEVDEVFEAIVRHARESKEHSPTFSDLFNGKYRHDGKDIPFDAEELPSPDQVDNRKIPPAVLLVKDHGAYLMSNGLPRQIDPDGEGDTSVVLYARGMDPNRDEDWWANASAALGGDDFAEALPLEWFQRALDLGAKHMRLLVTENEIQAVYVGVRKHAEKGRTDDAGSLTVPQLRALVKERFPHLKIQVQGERTPGVRARLTITGDRSIDEFEQVNAWAVRAGVRPDRRVRPYELEALREKREENGLSP